MMVSVKAVRDSDGLILGETVVEFTNRQARQRALTELLEEVYSHTDAITLPPFTFQFREEISQSTGI